MIPHRLAVKAAALSGGSAGSNPAGGRNHCLLVILGRHARRVDAPGTSRIGRATVQVPASAVFLMAKPRAPAFWESIAS